MTTDQESELLARITSDPAKCGGQPCIRGMRIRVVDVLEIADATHAAPPLAPGQRVEASVRPTQIMIRRPGDTFEGRVNVFAAQIAHEIMGAETYRIFVKLPGSVARHDLEIDLPAYTYFRLGLDHDKEIEISIRPEAVHIIHSA